jgi:hypothetical protein
VHGDGENLIRIRRHRMDLKQRGECRILRAASPRAEGSWLRLLFTFH